LNNNTWIIDNNSIILHDTCAWKSLNKFFPKGIFFWETNSQVVILTLGSEVRLYKVKHDLLHLPPGLCCKWTLWNDMWLAQRKWDSEGKIGNSTLLPSCLSSFFPFLPSFLSFIQGSTRDCTQGFMTARQVAYNLIHTTSHFSSS
jgi:hypothetical protein